MTRTEHSNIYLVGIFKRPQAGIRQHPVALVIMQTEEDHDAAWATAFRELRARNCDGGYCKRVDADDLPAYDRDPAYRIPRVSPEAAIRRGA